LHLGRAPDRPHRHGFLPSSPLLPAFTGADGTTAVVVVDGIGNSPQVTEMAHVLATAIARLAVRVDARSAQPTAGQVIGDRGLEGDAPNAFAVVAVARPGTPTKVAWVGDTPAHGFNRDLQRLHRYTTPVAVGEQLRRNGAPWEIAAEHDNWVPANLATAAVGNVYTVDIPSEEVVLLCSDGVPDGLARGRLDELAAEHADRPAALAEADATATEPDSDGYRDDATLVVLEPAP
ncbi:hypothetical protein AB0J52_03500, partial [Spirillospora sp. NPDC049652]